VLPIQATSIYVQVGSFTQYDNANRLRVRLQQIGPTQVTQVTVSGQPFFRVWMGPTDSVPEADRLLDQLVRAGYHDARIVVE
jgi:cell division protein FtsN